MKNKLLLMAILTLSSVANAEDYYKITVSRDESNMYRVDGTQLYIQTKFCHEYGYYEKAVLVWHGRGSWNNKLVFLDYNGKSKASCDVRRVYKEVDL